MDHNYSSGPYDTAYPPPYGDQRYSYPSGGYELNDYPGEGHDRFYPRAPVVHEGFVPDGNDSSDSEEEGVTAFEFLERSHTYNPLGLRPPIEGEDISEAEQDDGDPLGVVGMNSDYLLLDAMDVDFPLVEANDPAVDPDFAPPDEEVSADDLSLDSEQEYDEAMQGAGRRGAKRGRGSRGGRGGRGRRGRGRGRGGWKWALKGTEHDDRVSKRGGTRGRPRKNRLATEDGSDPDDEGRKSTRGKPKKGPALSDEYKRLQALANLHFVNNNLEEAADYARRAVLANPEVFPSHSLLSEIYLEMGQEEESIQALLAGAHTQTNPQMWLLVAERTLKHHNRNMDSLELAAYCYEKALKYKPDDEYEIRRERLAVNLERGATVAARANCRGMLKLNPTDLSILRQHAMLCAGSKHEEEIAKARGAYETAISHLKEQGPAGRRQFDFGQLNIYMELFGEKAEWNDAIAKLKRHSRWLLDREDETFWEDYQEDDREWDMSHEPRRTEIVHFANASEVKPLSAYGEGLPIELRARLGIFRLRKEPPDLEEAKRHFDVVYPEDDDSNAGYYWETYKDIAEAYRTRKLYSQALRFYEAMQSVKEACDKLYYSGLAECYLELDMREDAENVYRFIVDDLGGSVDSRQKLINLLSGRGATTEALHYTDEAIRIAREHTLKYQQLQLAKAKLKAVAEEGRVGEPIEDVVSSVRDQRVRKNKRHQQTKVRTLVRTEESVKYNHSQLHVLQDAADEGDPEALDDWMASAESMIGNFREMEAFYPSRDKHLKFAGYVRNRSTVALNQFKAMREEMFRSQDMEDTGESLEAVPDDYHGIGFDRWCDIFCEYAINLAKNGESDMAYDVLYNASRANVFYHNVEFMKQVHATWLACAIFLNDEYAMTNVARWYAERWGHSGTAYQLFANITRLYTGEGTWLNSGPTQKFMLRALKSVDYALLDARRRQAYHFTPSERSAYTKNHTQEANRHGLAELDPGLLALYAHIMTVAGTYGSALLYYFRAFAIRPRDVSLALCLATCYAQYAFKRQSPNRQFHVQQALALLARYRDIRTADGGDGAALHRQEAEFNVARMWHLLGLAHLAVPGYERCLELEASVVAEREAGVVANRGDRDAVAQSFAPEAALALQSIFALNGNERMARAVGEKWLVM
ncbi:transcription factor TFIIIC subunit tfc4 [Elasticomyces elasticus]|nr:transcription factor TFIIIC subunit tfc4 [Elasticomyces elasticus]